VEIIKPYQGKDGKKQRLRIFPTKYLTKKKGHDIMVIVKVIAFGGNSCLIEYNGIRYWVWKAWLTFAPDKKTAIIAESWVNDENEARR